MFTLVTFYHQNLVANSMKEPCLQIHLLKNSEAVSHQFVVNPIFLLIFVVNLIKSKQISSKYVNDIAVIWRICLKTPL